MATNIPVIMFSTEDQKMRLYKANLKKVEANQFKQGLKLQEYLDYEKGIESSQAGLDRFAEAIGEKVGDNLDGRVVKPVNKLKGISTDENGVLIDGRVKSKAPKKAATIKDKSAVFGVDEFGTTIKRKSPNMPKSIAQPPKPKTMISTAPILELAKAFDANYELLFGDENRATENAMMSAEDSLSRLTAAITAAATKREISGMAAEDAISVFRELSDKEDAKIRQKFMNVLDEMADKAKTQKNWELINRLQDLIERQRLADAFDRLEENRLLVNDAFATKLQRNLKAAMFEKKINRRIANKQMGEEDKLSQSMEKTIQQRMAELRAKKNSKSEVRKNRSDSDFTDATDLGSMADVSMRGRPKTENLEAKRLAKFKELDSLPNLTKKQKKQKNNLQAQLFRQGMAQEDIPKHRPTRGSNLRK